MPEKDGDVPYGMEGGLTPPEVPSGYRSTMTRNTRWSSAKERARAAGTGTTTEPARDGSALGTLGSLDGVRAFV